MKTFFRIFDDQLHGFQIDEIGFSSIDPSYIPDEVFIKKFEGNWTDFLNN